MHGRCRAEPTCCVLRARRLLQHFAELGASYRATKPPPEEDAPAQSYTVMLLRDPAAPNRTLAEALPKLKLGARKGR